jgi:HEAT repeat protein
MVSAMSSLARLDSAHAREWLPRFLGIPSRNEVLASTALGLISRADSAQGVALAMERIRAGTPDRVRGQAMSILRRPLKHSPEVEQLFIGLLHDRVRWVRSSAVNSLGNNGGKPSLAALEAVAADTENDLAKQAREAADKVAARLKDNH